MNRREILTLALAATSLSGLAAGCCGGNSSYSSPTPTPSPSSSPPPATGADPVAIFSGFADGNRELFRRGADGAITRLTTTSESERDPDISADGTRLLFRTGNLRQGDLYIAQLDGTGRTRLTTSGKINMEPRFSPDGTRILYSEDTNRTGPTPTGGTDTVTQIKTMRTDGTDIQIVREGVEFLRPKFSPSGAKIVYHDIFQSTNARYWTMNPDGTGAIQIGSSNGYNVGHLEWLPSGRLVLSNTDITTNKTSLETWLPDGTDHQVLSSNAPLSLYFRAMPDGTRLLGSGPRSLTLYGLSDGTSKSLSTGAITNDSVGSDTNTFYLAIVPGT